MNHSKTCSISQTDAQLQTKLTLDYHLEGVPVVSDDKDPRYLVLLAQQRLYYRYDLENCLVKELSHNFGHYFECIVYKQKQEVLDINFKQDVLYYLTADEDSMSWAQKLATQEKEMSNGRKFIGVIRLLRNKEFQKHKKLMHEQKGDTAKGIEAILMEQRQQNFDMDQEKSAIIERIRMDLIPAIQYHLSAKLARQKEKAKALALSSKYRQFKPRRQRLFFYVEKQGLGSNLSEIYRMSEKSRKYRWAEIIPFQSFDEILSSVETREKEAVEQKTSLKTFSQKSLNSSKRSLSKFDISRSHSRLQLSRYQNHYEQPSSTTILSSRHMPVDKMRHNLPKCDKNYIICSPHNHEYQKLYHYVMAQIYGNWKIIEYSDQNIKEINSSIKQLLRKASQKSQLAAEWDIIHAKTLYVFAAEQDMSAQRVQQESKNYFGNSQMVLYQSAEQLRSLLNLLSTNVQSYTIVLLKQPETDEHRQVMEFIEKNNHSLPSHTRNSIGNLLYRFTDVAWSALGNYQQEFGPYEWLRAVFEDRNRNFHPIDGLSGRYVYILVRFDQKDKLIDEEMGEYIGASARIQLAAYRDENYLINLIRNIRRNDNSVIILTNDQSLREAQSAANKFDEVSILNITDRNMKQETKVMLWGPKQKIYSVIRLIKSDMQELHRRPYTQKKPDISYYRSHQTNPEPIDLKAGSSITVRMPYTLKQNDTNTRTMQNNLNAYFNQSIRFEYFSSPKQLRLIDEKQELMSYVVCSSRSKEDFQYICKIAEQQKNHIRQEYIVYASDADKHRYLVEDSKSKHQRFKLVTNSWEKIEEYIIGRAVPAPQQKVEQKLQDQKNHNFIYSNESVNIFYYISEQNIVSKLMSNLRKTDQKLEKRIRLHRMRKTNDFETMNQIAALSSPHDLFYFILNERDHNFDIERAVELVKQSNSGYRNFPVSWQYRVPPKNIQILRLANESGSLEYPVFARDRQLIEYICDTRVQLLKNSRSKPHVLTCPSTANWHYFLGKATRCLHHQHCPNWSQVKQVIERIREQDSDCQIWMLLSTPDDLYGYSRQMRQVQGHQSQVAVIYHGNKRDIMSNKFNSKVVFADRNRLEVEAFLLNSQKRSYEAFSPELLLPHQAPIVCMSPSTSERVIISEDEIKKWVQDLQAQFYIQTDKYPVSLSPQRRPIIVIKDINENLDMAFLRGHPNVWTVLFDSNQNEVNKVTNLTLDLLEDKRNAFVGNYPGQISRYLRCLRYNLKNPPAKLSDIYDSPVVRVYKEADLPMSASVTRKLLDRNHSIANLLPFDNVRQALLNVQKYPGYDILMIVRKDNAQQLYDILSAKGLLGKIKYIVVDEQWRKSGVSMNNQTYHHAELVTEDALEFNTYLFNMPQKRYEQAKQWQKPVQVRYIDYPQFVPLAQELSRIGQHNPCFSLKSYHLIEQLKEEMKRQPGQEYVILLTDHLYQMHAASIPKGKAQYFVVTENRNKYLLPDTVQKSECFITKDYRELSAYFMNCMVDKSAARKAKDKLLKSKSNKSIPLDKGRSKAHLQQFVGQNFIDSDPTSIFKLPAHFQPDYPLTREDINSYSLNKPITATYPSNTKSQTRREFTDSNNPKIQNHREIIYQSNPKVQNRREIIYQSSPKIQTRREVYRQPQYNTKSQYELMNRSQNVTTREASYQPVQSYRTVPRESLVFSVPKPYVQPIPVAKYVYHTSSDGGYASHTNYDHYYLGDQTIQSKASIIDNAQLRHESIILSSKHSPYFWNQTNLFNIMVPISMKKKYDALKSSHVTVIPYRSNTGEDLQAVRNQMHRKGEFVIIVTGRQNYEMLEQFPKLSPRCIILIEDPQIVAARKSQAERKQLEEYCCLLPDKQVLYYGADAYEYLLGSSIMDANPLRCRPEQLNVVFYGASQKQQVIDDKMTKLFEKVQYADHEDLFVKIVERFKKCNNYIYGSEQDENHLVSIFPKIFMLKDAPYQNNYLELKQGETTALFKSSTFKRNPLQPHEYSHLPLQYYSDLQELHDLLAAEKCPCLVLVDARNPRALEVRDRFKNILHLFVMLQDINYTWIQNNGDLTAISQPLQSSSLQRQRAAALTKKQILFTRMFNSDVFQSYNDIQYYYLSNKHNKADSPHHQILPMSKEQLETVFFNHPNLLMVVFVEQNDKVHISKLMPTSCKDADRIKLIFVNHSFLDSDQHLCIRYNEIDPVIRHIEKVENAGRFNYCLYPATDLANLMWHQFMSHIRADGRQTSWKSIKFAKVFKSAQMEKIAKDIKGKFRQVHVLCEQKDQQAIQRILQSHSIQTKSGTNQRVQYQLLPSKPVEQITHASRPNQGVKIPSVSGEVSYGVNSMIRNAYENIPLVTSEQVIAKCGSSDQSPKSSGTANIYETQILHQAGMRSSYGKSSIEIERYGDKEQHRSSINNDRLLQLDSLPCRKTEDGLGTTLQKFGLNSGSQTKRKSVTVIVNKKHEASTRQILKNQKVPVEVYQQLSAKLQQNLPDVQQKDGVMIVVFQEQLLSQVSRLSPKTRDSCILILLNAQNKQFDAKYRQFVDVQMESIDELRGVVSQINR